MYILYLDESGTHAEASYFVLAGLAVFEREIFWFGKDLDDLQREYFPTATESLFFHATRLRSKSKEEPWSQLSEDRRIELKNRVYDILRNRRAVLFGIAVEKSFASIRNEDPYERAFEDIISRFDLFMSRMNLQPSNDNLGEQRGLVVLAQSSYQKTIGLLGQRLQQRGTRWGDLHNVADVPLFAPAQDTRLLQYADFCANAIYGRYHSGLTRDFDRIAGKFDRDGGVVHGLNHLTIDAQCACMACVGRLSR